MQSAQHQEGSRTRHGQPKSTCQSCCHQQFARVAADKRERSQRFNSYEGAFFSMPQYSGWIRHPGLGPSRLDRQFPIHTIPYYCGASPHRLVTTGEPLFNNNRWFLLQRVSVISSLDLHRRLVRVKAGCFIRVLVGFAATAVCSSVWDCSSQSWNF